MSLDKLATSICSRMKSKLDIAPYGKPVFIKGSEGYVVALSVDSLKDALDKYEITGKCICKCDGTYTAKIDPYSFRANAYTEYDAKIKVAKLALEHVENNFERIIVWGDDSYGKRQSIMRYIKTLIAGSPQELVEMVRFNHEDRELPPKKKFWR